jgi:hypothetical protein
MATETRYRIVTVGILGEHSHAGGFTTLDEAKRYAKNTLNAGTKFRIKKYKLDFSTRSRR